MEGCRVWISRFRQQWYLRARTKGLGFRVKDVSGLSEIVDDVSTSRTH